MKRYNSIEKIRLARMMDTLINQFGKTSNEVQVFLYYYRNNYSMKVITAFFNAVA